MRRDCEGQWGAGEVGDGHAPNLVAGHRPDEAWNQTLVSSSGQTKPLYREGLHTRETQNAQNVAEGRRKQH